ncbi:Imm1 family immunity protein [Saccharothrix violaceirubra]|uniref:Imm1 family immunity protein n=1 Tax=Saccharothrix violaceirubra TaxID=413306 RepID=UPI0028B16CD7|nr:Imm1 family immunity protein [Saccharothrix violaceirubra]
MYCLYEHGDTPVTVSTVDEADALIGLVRVESPSAAPVLLDVHLSGDPYAQGSDVGITVDRGVIRYSGPEWPHGVVSAGNASTDGEPRSYFYMGHGREFPANSEVPIDVVRQAVKEFMESSGARPTCVRWQDAP